MLRWVAIALATAGRFSAASIVTDALSSGHAFAQGSLFGHHVFGGKDFAPRRVGEPEGRRRCEDHDRRTAVTSRFPAPWRIVELPNGFVVADAAGQQLGVFYGRADPNTAGHTGYVTLDEAREFAADFARLPELLERDSGS